MATAKPGNIVSFAGRTRARSKSGETGDIAAMTEGRTRLMRLYDRFEEPIAALGARLDPSMGDLKTLDEITEN